MTGPVGDDLPPAPDRGLATGPTLEVTPSRESVVGEHTVARALPTRGRRTVGAWCFADHMLPSAVPMRVGPHPHIGLQTVTWLVAGELLHTDSLGSEQVIRPGQLNLMTAGRGVAHAEEAPATGGVGHGMQLWVAQPEATRHGEPAFEHHPDLPRAELGGAEATVLVGTLAGATSPARRDTDLVGADLVLADGATVAVPVDPAHEHALVAMAGAVSVDGTEVPPGRLAYLGTGRHEVGLTAVAPDTRLLLLGGVPFPETVLMWWNFVARTREEVDEARAAWEAGDARFGPVRTGLDRIPAPPTLWR